MKRIPVSTPAITAAERKAVADCLDAGWVSSEGPQVAAFEAAFAAYCGRRHGIAVSSGTAALEVAVRALGIGPGDEVLVPSLTIISCAQAIVYAGARPVPVDCDPTDWNAHLKDFRRRLTARTRAIMLVHLYGLCADLRPIIQWAKQHKLLIIEDASQAAGLSYRSKPCGSFGDISIFSLYANKAITTGEGGMILCTSAELARRCRSLRNLCFGARRFVHDELGWNYRMSALQAALGIPQLRRLDRIARRKRAIGLTYRRAFRDLDDVQLAPAENEHARNAYWMFGLVIGERAGVSRDGLMRALKKKGIDTRPFFHGLHEQPALLKSRHIRPIALPVTERLSRRGLYLPSGLGLSESDQNRVIREVRALLRKPQS